MSDKAFPMKLSDDLSALYRTVDTLEEAAQALGRSDERLRLALDAGRMGVWEVDETTRIGHMDETEAVLLGFPPDTREIPVSEFLSRVHPDDRAEIMRRVAQAKVTGHDYSGEYRVLLPDGDVRWIANRGRFVYSSGGKPLRLVGVEFDITRRKHAEAQLRGSEQRFHAIFDGTFEFIGLLKPDGTVIEANQTALEFIGAPAAEVVGRPFWETPWWQGSPEQQERLKKAIAEAAQGKFVRFEAQHPSKDGRIDIIDFSVRPITDETGRVTMIIPEGRRITERKRAEQALRDSEQRLQHALAAGGMGTWERNLRTGEIRWDERAYQMYGIESGTAVDVNSLNARVHPDDVATMQSAIDHTVRTGAEYRCSFRFYRPDGRTVWIHARGGLRRDESGTTSHIVGVNFDVTERHKTEQALRESEERLTQAVHAAEIGIFEHDHRTDQFYWSPTLRQIYGADADEPASLERYVELLHPDERDLVLAAIRQAHDPAGEGLYCVEHRLVRRDGSVHWVYVRSQTLFDGEGIARRPVRTVGAVVDVSERNRLESELHKRVEQLGEADRRKDEFIATLAHELRNPLAPIRNVINLLGKKGALEPDVQRAHDIISRQIHHFTRLIDDLLDVSRITRDKLELRKQRVTLSEVIDAAVEISRPLIDRNGYRLTINLPAEPIYLDADAIRLSQVFMNLLNNAAKYTPQNGLINLSAERDGDNVAVRIADNGIGIAADQLPHLFDMFYQADRTYEQSQGGLGIGLTLVWRLVEMHGGKVEAHSAGLNQGSEFVVHLPVLTAHSDVQGQTEAVDNFPTAARRILVVDDYGDSADTLAELLGFDGNDVRVAHDGLEALEIAETFRPRVALLDLGMPKLNGYETASKIRERPWGKDMLLVAVTGWGEEDVMERTKEAGFDAHILKPVDYPELSKLLADFSSRDDPVDVGDR